MGKILNALKTGIISAPRNEGGGQDRSPQLGLTTPKTWSGNTAIGPAGGRATHFADTNSRGQMSNVRSIPDSAYRQGSPTKNTPSGSRVGEGSSKGGSSLGVTSGTTTSKTYTSSGPIGKKAGGLIKSDQKSMKKKMSREERAEYKNGKYTGGPAEEKAEMKKKSKRMADGGLTQMAKAAMARRSDANRPDGMERRDRNKNAAAGGGRGMGLPPGLAKRGPGNLPPGLAKRASLPPGLGGAKTEAPRPPMTPKVGPGPNDMHIQPPPTPANPPKLGDYSGTGGGYPTADGITGRGIADRSQPGMVTSGPIMSGPITDGRISTPLTPAKPPVAPNAGLPPGLAKRAPGDMPPGLQNRPLPPGLANRGPIAMPMKTMKGGGLARRGVGMALAKGGMVRGNGMAQRGKTRGKMC